jgi:hypothetical protein
VGPSADIDHPVPYKGLSALYVVTEVLGAKASLIGSRCSKLSECQIRPQTSTNMLTYPLWL